MELVRIRGNVSGDYRVCGFPYPSVPFAFVAMLFGELYAATAGLGFMMVVASATYQTNKAFAGFLITVILLLALSTNLRWIVKRFYSLEESPIVPVQ